MLEPATILLSLILAYFWVTLPGLRGMSLQFAAALFLLYFVSKRFTSRRLHHLLPTRETWEAALLVGAVTVVIGGTGGILSPFLALILLLLFVSALTLTATGNAVEMVGLLVFLWAVSAHPFGRDQWIQFAELPLLLPILIFARMQFEEAQVEKEYAAESANQEARQGQEIILFLSTNLRPRLGQFRQMLLMSEVNREGVARQLGRLEEEVQELAKEFGEDPANKTPEV